MKMFVGNGDFYRKMANRKKKKKKKNSVVDFYINPHKPIDDLPWYDTDSARDGALKKKYGNGYKPNYNATTKFGKTVVNKKKINKFDKHGNKQKKFNKKFDTPKYKEDKLYYNFPEDSIYYRTDPIVITKIDNKMEWYIKRRIVWSNRIAEAIIADYNLKPIKEEEHKAKLLELSMNTNYRDQGNIKELYALGEDNSITYIKAEFKSITINSNDGRNKPVSIFKHKRHRRPAVKHLMTNLVAVNTVNVQGEIRRHPTSVCEAVVFERNASLFTRSKEEVRKDTNDSDATLIDWMKMKPTKLKERTSLFKPE